MNISVFFGSDLCNGLYVAVKLYSVTTAFDLWLNGSIVWSGGRNIPTRNKYVNTLSVSDKSF